jgi:hypothetical protein
MLMNWDELNKGYSLRLIRYNRGLFLFKETKPLQCV